MNNPWVWVALGFVALGIALGYGWRMAQETEHPDICRSIMEGRR